MRLLSLRCRLRAPRRAAAQALILLAFGTMPLFSQEQGQSSNNYAGNTQTWNTLSQRFQNELSGLQKGLQAALKEAETSATSLKKLTDLLESSSRRIASLEGFTEQVGQRMQERDNDLYRAYLEIEELEKLVLKNKASILRHRLIIAAMGLIISVIALIKAGVKR